MDGPDWAMLAAMEWLGCKFIGESPPGWTRYAEDSTASACRDETNELAEIIRRHAKLRDQTGPASGG